MGALWLTLTGYQILGFKLKSRTGEIDILARHGHVLAVVEVSAARRLRLHSLQSPSNST